ncbi:hypothetical protein SRHO_G00161460 [Serrasalmus rhombeus]
MAGSLSHGHFIFTRCLFTSENLPRAHKLFQIFLSANRGMDQTVNAPLACSKHDCFHPNLHLFSSLAQWLLHSGLIRVALKFITVSKTLLVCRRPSLKYTLEPQISSAPEKVHRTLTRGRPRNDREAAQCFLLRESAHENDAVGSVCYAVVQNHQSYLREQRPPRSNQPVSFSER